MFNIAQEIYRNTTYVSAWQKDNPGKDWHRYVLNCCKNEKINFVEGLKICSEELKKKYPNVEPASVDVDEIIFPVLMLQELFSQLHRQ